LQKNGNGTYFFIDKSENIPTLVEKAFKALNRTVASNVILQVKAKNGVTIKKLQGNENLLQGIQLGDLRESDLKQILLEVQIPEGTDMDPLEILSFELQYKKIVESIPSSPVTGNLYLTPSNNFDDLLQLENEVLVYLKIHECSEIDKQVLAEINSGRYLNAYNLKSQAVEILSEIAEKDELGFAKVLLKKAKTRLDDILGMMNNTSSKSREIIKKELHYEAMQEEDEDMGYSLFD